MNNQLQHTLRVIDRIKQEGDSEQQRDEVDFGCTSPTEMNSQVFERLQHLCESLDMARARGEDCIPGFDDLQEEVHRLLDASPWTLHPDEGLVREKTLGIEPRLD